VGTLTYTQGQLVNVFFWLLWGDFCLNVMEQVIPRLVPLQLGKLGASNALIAVLTVSIFSAMNWVMNPVISTWSDRHRGPRGRRIPFMLWPTPALAFFVIMVGFATNVGGYILHRWPGAAEGMRHGFVFVLRGTGGLPPAAQMGIGMIAVALVLYKFFDEFPQCVYYYIWADVIPKEVMGRFTSYFRVVAALGGMAFNQWVVGYADTYPQAVYLGCGLLYLFAFLLMSMIVKEGEYPPPPEKQGDVGKTVWVWVKECYGNLYYWKFYAVYSCFRWVWMPFNALLIVYAEKGVGMTAKEFGKKMVWAQGAQVVIFMLAGPIVDRFHPVRVGVAGFAAMMVAGVLGFFFTTGPMWFGVWVVVAFAAIALYQGSLVSLGPVLLPRARYGQFCAATMMVVESGVMVLSWVCGRVMDVMGDRYLWMWMAGCSGLGVLATMVLYRAWRSEGGDLNYVAPGGFDTEIPCVVKATQ
jgi:MFS family permease